MAAAIALERQIATAVDRVRTEMAAVQDKLQAKLQEISVLFRQRGNKRKNRLSGSDRNMTPLSRTMKKPGQRRHSSKWPQPLNVSERSCPSSAISFGRNWMRQCSCALNVVPN